MKKIYSVDNYMIGIKNFTVNTDELQSFIAPHYVQKAWSKSYVIEYYANLFKNYMLPNECQVEEEREGGSLKSFSYQDLKLDIEDINYFIDNKFDASNPKINEALNKIKDIKLNQLECITTSLNNKLSEDNNDALKAFFTEYTNRAYFYKLNNENLASHFNINLIDVNYKVEEEMHGNKGFIGYIKEHLQNLASYFYIKLIYGDNIGYIKEHLQNSNAAYLKELGLKNISSSFCKGDYQQTLTDILPGVIVSGNNNDNINKLSKLIATTIMDNSHAPVVKATLIAAIANLINCKYDLADNNCKDSSIFILPQPFVTFREVSGIDGFVKSTMYGVVSDGKEISIPFDKIDIISHELSHYLDARLGNEDYLPYPLGDLEAASELNKLSTKVGFNGALTEYMAYAITREVSEALGISNTYQEWQANYKEVSSWRMNYIFKKDDGVLFQSIKNICPADSPVFGQINEIFDQQHLLDEKLKNPFGYIEYCPSSPEEAYCYIKDSLFDAPALHT